MKMLDPKNVTIRADRMMKHHISIFENHFGKAEKELSSYFFGNDEDWVSVSYETLPKFLTKVFTTKIKMQLSNINMQEDLEAKLQILGNFKATGIIFRERKNKVTKEISRINSNHILLDRVYSQMKDFDIQNMTIKYSKISKVLSVEISPYAGAFVWVKLPPIYHDIRFKDFEVKKIYDILETLKEYFIENYRMKIKGKMLEQ